MKTLMIDIVCWLLLLHNVRIDINVHPFPLTSISVVEVD